MDNHKILGDILIALFPEVNVKPGYVDAKDEYPAMSYAIQDNYREILGRGVRGINDLTLELSMYANTYSDIIKISKVIDANFNGFLPSVDYLRSEVVSSVTANEKKNLYRNETSIILKTRMSA